MSPYPSNTISVSIPITRVYPCPKDAGWVCCLHCDEALELCQPESDDPIRLIGTCEACGRWYLLDWQPGSGHGLMLLLPDAEVLRGFFAENDGKRASAG